MKMRPRSCLITFFVTASLVFLALAALFSVVFVYQRAQGVKATQYKPPLVNITEPQTAFEAPTGNQINVSAVATGFNPIVRLELWADGELVATLEHPEAVENQPFYGYFDYTVVEGTQFLFTRAVNTAGIVGQSQAVAISGVPRQDLSQSFYLLSREEGATLASIAGEYGVSLEELNAANPELGGQLPAPGTLLQVPIAAQNEPSAPPAPAPQAGQPAPQIQAPPTGKQLVQLPDNLIFNLFNNALLPLAGSLDIPPSAPSDLKASLNGCDLYLIWQDNATNEQQYEVWIATPYLKRVATLKAAPNTGTVWFKVAIPSHEKMVFWVEAVNQYGKSSSNLVAVTNNPTCLVWPNTEFVTHLKFQLQSGWVAGNHDRFYCYISTGKVPEVRIPNDDNTFIEVVNGGMSKWPTGKTQYIVPVPESGVLDFKGECLGWAGNTLNKLGPFTAQFKLGDLQAFNGLLKVKTVNYEFTFTVSWKPNANPLDVAMGLPYAFGFSDPTIPKPYALQVSSFKGIYPPGDTSWKLDRNLEWKWDGDESKINGFTILRNGVPLLDKPVPANARQTKVWIPAECGESVRWEVAAISDVGIALSAPYEYTLPKCNYYLVISFVEIYFYSVYDYSPGFYKPSGCNQVADGYFFLSVNGEKRDFFGGNYFIPFKGCKSFNLADITNVYKNKYPQPNVFRVPLPDKDQMVWATVKAQFWDYDTASPNDLLSSFYDSSVGGSYQYLSQDILAKGETCRWLVSKALSGHDGSGQLQLCLSLEVKPAGQ